MYSGVDFKKFLLFWIVEYHFKLGELTNTLPTLELFSCLIGKNIDSLK